MTQYEFDALVQLMKAVVTEAYKPISATSAIDFFHAYEKARKICVEEAFELTKEDYETIYGWGGQDR